MIYDLVSKASVQFDKLVMRENLYNRAMALNSNSWLDHERTQQEYR